MCGRFTLTVTDFDELLAGLGAVADPELAALYEPRYNAAPMQEHWIMRAEHEERRLRRATWGLVNWWEHDRRAGAKHINARSESINQRQAFREAFQERRCAIPADGFFEWTGEANQRRPLWFHRPDRGVILFAGLYAVSRLPGEDTPTTTFTILTTSANATMAPVHDRMPVILPGEAAADAWLYERQTAERLHELLHPVDDAFLTPLAVSTRVNSVRYDDPACLAEGEAEMQGSLL